MKKLTKFQKQELFNRVVEILNGAVASDSKAMQELVGTRVECNESLALHPTVQVLRDEKEGKDYVGLVGVLNGIIEPLLGQRIAYQTNEFKKLLKFCPYGEGRIV